MSNNLTPEENALSARSEQDIIAEMDDIAQRWPGPFSRHFTSVAEAVATAKRADMGDDRAHMKLAEMYYDGVIIASPIFKSKPPSEGNIDQKSGYRSVSFPKYLAHKNAAAALGNIDAINFKEAVKNGLRHDLLIARAFYLPMSPNVLERAPNATIINDDPHKNISERFVVFHNFHTRFYEEQAYESTKNFIGKNEYFGDYSLLAGPGHYFFPKELFSAITSRGFNEQEIARKIAPIYNDLMPSLILCAQAGSVTAADAISAIYGGKYLLHVQ